MTEEVQFLGSIIGVEFGVGLWCRKRYIFKFKEQEQLIYLLMT